MNLDKKKSGSVILVSVCNLVRIHLDLVYLIMVS